MRFDLRRALFILPNFITLLSIFCGFYSIVVCTRGGEAGQDFYSAALLIVFAMFFDVLDGRVARMTKTQSAFGVQIDSLADVISFGVAPALLVYRWSLHQLGLLGVLLAFLYVAGGAIRLARFNVLSTAPSGAPKKPSKYIVGLPIPGAAGMLVSIIVANFAVDGTLHALPTVIGAVVLALSFFMVSTVAFRSFKDIQLGWRSVGFVVLTVASSAAVAVTLHPSFALVWLIGGYVVIALVETLLQLSQRARGRAAEGEAERRSVA